MTGQRFRLQPLLLRAALALAVGAILAFTVPWDAWQTHSHWEKVEWIPFSRHYGTWIERILNVVLFVPLGATLLPRVRRVWLSAALGGLLSIAVEFLQVYSHGRLPTATDVLLNTLGTLLGAMVVRRWLTGRRG